MKKYVLFITILVVILGTFTTTYADGYTHQKFMNFYEDLLEEIISISKSNKSKDDRIDSLIEIMEKYNEDDYDIDHCLRKAKRPDEEDKLRASLLELLGFGIEYRIDSIVDEYDGDDEKIKDLIEDELVKYNLDEEFRPEDILKVYDNNPVADELERIYNEHQDEIKLDKSPSKWQSDFVDKVTIELIEDIDRERYVKTDNLLFNYLSDNNMGYTINRPCFGKIINYQDNSYTTLDQAINVEIMDKLRYRYSKDELDKIVVYLDNYLRENAMGKFNLENVYKNKYISSSFLRIFSEYNISEMPEIVYSNEIIDLYMSYNRTGYDTKLDAINYYARRTLNRAIGDDLLRIISSSNYDKNIILRDVTVLLNNKENYKNNLDYVSLDKLLLNQSTENNYAIVELFLDSIIKSKHRDLSIYEDVLSEQLASSIDCRIAVYDYLEEKGLQRTIDVDDMIMEYIILNNSERYTRYELYNRFFKKFEIGTTLVHDDIKIYVNESINALMNKKDGIDISGACRYQLNNYMLSEYVEIDAIKEIYYKAENQEGDIIYQQIKKLVEEGINKRLKNDITELKNKDISHKEKLNQLRIILKVNMMDSRLTDSELEDILEE